MYCFCLLASLLAAAPKKPKLVVAIVIDQFRYDYLTRFRSEYHAGFDRLLTKGAVYTNANYIHFPTVTAVGHSTFLTGATPSYSGIVGNDWFDRDENKHVTSVSDSKTKLLGGIRRGRVAAPDAGEHGRRRAQNGGWRQVPSDRHLAERSRGDPARRAHGQRRLLVRPRRRATS